MAFMTKNVGSVYFASWSNTTAKLFYLRKHNSLKWSWQVQNA